MWQLTRIDNVAESELGFSDGKGLFAIRGGSTSTRLVISDQGFIDFTYLEYSRTTDSNPLPPGRLDHLDLNHQSITIPNRAPSSPVRIHLVLPGDGSFSFSTSPNNSVSGILKPLPKVSKTDIESFQQMINRRLVPYPLGSGQKSHEEIRVLGSRYLPFLPHTFELAMVIYDWTTPSFARMVIMKMFEYAAIPGNPHPIDKSSVASAIFDSNWLSYKPDDPDYMRSFLMTPTQSKQGVLAQLETVLPRLQYLSAVENRLLSVAVASMPRTPKLSVPRLYSGQLDMHQFKLDQFGIQFTQCPLNTGPPGTPLQIDLNEALETFLQPGKAITTKQAWSLSDSLDIAMTYQNGIVLVVQPPDDGSLVWETPSYVTPLSCDPNKVEWIFPLGTTFTVLSTDHWDIHESSVLVITLKQSAPTDQTGVAQPSCKALFSKSQPISSWQKSDTILPESCKASDSWKAFDIDTTNRRAWFWSAVALFIILISRFVTVHLSIVTERFGMFDPLNSTSPAIEKWEEAGASLAAALSKYLELSISLGMSSLKENTPPKVTATRIDTTLESLHVTISGQISQARSTLARTRNHILSSTYRLPDEVLAEIFAYIIFVPSDPYDPVSMTDSLVKMYRQLHTLASVSCMWRNLALSRGEFWSTVPIVDPDYSPFSLRFKRATKLSLTRATHGDLHLAAIRDYRYRPIGLLRDHASRFRTVNITAKSRYSIDSTFRPFLKLGPSKRLSKLSLRIKSEAPPKQNNLILDEDHLFPFNSEDRESFDELIKSLSVVRICGVQIHWGRTVFSKQLIELHLQDITLGYDIAMANLLRALASATELRELKLISVSTFYNTQMLLSPTPGSIVLPKLQNFLIQDLYSSTLSLVLDAITSRSHELTLHLTQKCVQANIVGHYEPEEVGIDDIYSSLENTAVHALLIDGNDHEPWVSPDELESIIHVMPDLVSLEMKCWVYTTGYCRALQRPQRSNALLFPRIEYMHFSRARILDEVSFKRMVTSHSPFLEQMMLGAAVPGGPGDTEEWISLEDNDEIMRWLEIHVDIFMQMDYSHEQPEFLPPKWQLW